MSLISAHLNTSSTSPLLASIQSDRARVETTPDDTYPLKAGAISTGPAG